MTAAKNTTICDACGSLAEDDEDFCGSCGAYLEWEERATPDVVEVPSEPPAESEAEPEAGFADRVRAAVGLGRTSPSDNEDETTDPASAGQDDGVEPVLARPRTEPTPNPAEPPPGADADGPASNTPDAPAPQAPKAGTDASALVVGLARPTAAPVAPRKPQARRPGAAQPRARKRVAKPDQPLQPGDLVCGECGAGNKPDRKFCRRCGHDLQEAQVVHSAWWRRVFTRRQRSGPVAGTRPKVQGLPRRWPRRLIGLGLVLALIGGGAWLARDWVRPAYDRVQDRVQDSENINPTKWKASSSSPGHAAKRARDGFSNRYWAPAKPGNGKGESLTATFDEPFRLVSLVITPGVSGKDEEAFLKNGRPHEIQLVLIHADHARSVENIELEDKVGPASVDVHSSDVSSVKLTLVSSYAGSVDGSRTAIAEVEFRGRR